VIKMNYNNIAEFVHYLVKNPRVNELSSTQINTHEVTVIKKVFSECELSEDVLTFGSIPLGFWA
jgi:hypothetical protein